MRERHGVGGRTAGLSWSLPLWFVSETEISVREKVLRSHGHHPLNIWNCPLWKHLKACNFCAIFSFLLLLLGVRVHTFVDWLATEVESHSG